MKLSENEIKLLKHFSTMNKSILISQGSSIFTQASFGTLAAEYTIGEIFPFEFGIHDLKRFLSLMDLVGNDAELTFSEENNCVTIEQDTNSLRYHFSPPSVLKAYKKPSMMENLPPYDIEFILTQEAWGRLKAAAGALEVKHVIFYSEDDKIMAHVETVGAAKDDSKNTFGVQVGTLKEPADFAFVYQHEMMNLYRGSYKVEISSEGISQFTLLDDEINLTFWVGLCDNGTHYKKG